jgi:RNA polymerase sigma factor (sigma-70 family)
VVTTTTAVLAAEVATTSAAESLVHGGRPDNGTAALRVSELFERHGATVLGLCRVLLRNEHESEDATQQTFLAAYRSLLNGGEPRHPAAWLATIARNECWSIARRRMREPLGDAEPEGRLPDPVVAAAERADLRELWRAIGALPRQQRKAILLREFSGLSYDELAVALGVSEPAVESLLFRARRELRARLRPVYGSVVIAPLTAVRDALAPVAVKLGAGATAVVVAGGTVAAVETHALRRDLVVQPAVASALPDHARPVARGPVPQAPPRDGARTPLPHHPAPAPTRRSAPALQPRAPVPGVPAVAPAGGTTTLPVVTPPPPPASVTAPTTAPPEPQPPAGGEGVSGDDGSPAAGDDGTPETSGDGGTGSGEGSDGVDGNSGPDGGDDSSGPAGPAGDGDSSGPGGGDDSVTSVSSGFGGGGDDAVSDDSGSGSSSGSGGDG